MRTCLLVLLALTVAACDSAVTPEAPTPIVPLEVGASWEFAPTYTVRYGDEPDTTFHGDSSHPLTLTVTRDTVMGDERWYRLEMTDGYIDHCTLCRGASWLTHREDGLYKKCGDNAPELLYASEATVGVPFVQTDSLVVTLTDAETPVQLENGDRVLAAAFERDWRRVTVRGQAQKPISPSMQSTDFLSPDLGFVTLQTSYVALLGGDTLPPAMLKEWRLVRYNAP